MTTTKPRLKLWPHIKALFSKKQSGELPAWPHTIEGPKPLPVFRSQGTVYYHYQNDFQAKTMRISAALDIWKEISFNCNSEDLQAYLKTQDATANKILESLKVRNGVLDVSAAIAAIEDFKGIAKQFAQRTQWITNVGFALKLASVLFMDESEDPNFYDVEYATKVKIPRWERALANGEPLAFFFNSPIQELLSSSLTLARNSPQFGVLATEVHEHEKQSRLVLLTNLFNMLSLTSPGCEELRLLTSQMEILKRQTNCAG